MPSVVISSPPSTPPRHGLIDSAFPVNDPSGRWENGACFLPEVASQPESWVIPCVGPSSPAGPGADFTDGSEPPLGDLINLTPYQLVAPFTCDTSQWQTLDYRGRAERILTAGQSKAIEYELYSGSAVGEAALPAGEGNPQLTDSLTFTTAPINAGVAMPPRLALISLVQAAAAGPNGSRAMIHATPATAMAWIMTGGLKEEGGRLVTVVGGHIVVAGSGYTGAGPDNAATASTDEHWAWLTSPVHFLLGEIEITPSTIAQATNRRSNTVEYSARRTAVAYWDRTLHVGANINVMAELS